MAILSGGIILEQHKEPMLCRDMKVYPTVTKKLFESPILNKPEEELTLSDIIDIARQADIVDESDGKKLFEKLNSVENSFINTVTCDAVDDEPYASVQMNIALHKPEEVAFSLNLIKRALGAKECKIAVYKHIGETAIKIPSQIGGIPIDKIGGKYPAELLDRRRFRSRKGVFIIGAGALLHLYRAIKEGRAVTTCFITVAGDALAEPSNIEVPLGISAAELLEFTGLSAEPEALVIGGAMRGKSIFEPGGEYVNALSLSLLALRESNRSVNLPCIGCGRCDSVCPEGLSPSQLRRFAQYGKYDKFPLYDADKCRGCFSCSYICPAKLDVGVAIYRYAKEMRKGADTP